MSHKARSYHPLFLTNLELQSISLVSVAMQTYRVDVGVAQVIIGNEVLLKCDIPSFAADFVSVNAWIDSEGHSYSRDKHLGINLAGEDSNIDKKVQAIL